MSEFNKTFPNTLDKIGNGGGIYDTKLAAVKDKINELVKNQNKNKNPDDKEKDAELANLKKEKDKLENEKNESLKDKNKLEKEKSDLTQQLTNLKKEVKALEEKNNNEQVNALIKQRDDLQKQIKAKNTEAEKSNAKIKELENKIYVLENNNPDDKNKNKKIEELEEENKKLLEYKKAADAELAKLKKSKDENSGMSETPTDVSVFNKIAPSKAGNKALLIFSGVGSVVGLGSGSFILAFLIPCPSSLLIVGLIASGSCLVTGILGIGVGASNIYKCVIADNESKKPRQIGNEYNSNDNKTLEF